MPDLATHTCQLCGWVGPGPKRDGQPVAVLATCRRCKVEAYHEPMMGVSTDTGGSSTGGTGDMRDGRAVAPAV